MIKVSSNIAANAYLSDACDGVIFGGAAEYLFVPFFIAEELKREELKRAKQIYIIK